VTRKKASRQLRALLLVAELCSATPCSKLRFESLEIEKILLAVRQTGAPADFPAGVRRG